MAEFNFMEISSTSGTQGTEFDSGLKDFPFSIGAPNVWYPSKSYFRVDWQLRGNLAGGAPFKPTVAEQIAFADNAPGALLHDVTFNAGGQPVSKLNQYIPQAAMCKHRTRDTESWRKNVGSKAFLQEPSFTKRMAYTTGNVTPELGDESEYVDLGDSTHFNDYTVAIAITTGLVTGFQTDLEKLEKGDTLVVNGIKYEVLTEATNATGANMTVAPLAAAVAASAEAYGLVRRNAFEGRNTVYTMFQPAIGIFDYDKPLAAGNYTFQLNPNPNYKTSAIQTLRDTGVVPTNCDIYVERIRLYVATAKMVIPDDTITLDLMEVMVQSKVSSASGTNVEHFTVPSSTERLSVFVQSGDAGTNTAIPPGDFRCKDNSQYNLSNVQITYGGMTKPQTRWSSDYDNNTDRLQHRYLESMIETGLIETETGGESFESYMQRGPLVTYRFDTDRDNLSTEVQLQMDYSSIEAGARIFLVAHYRNSTTITTKAGQVVAVEQLRR